MGTYKHSVLRSFIGVMLLWPHIQTGSISSNKLSTVDTTYAEQGEVHPPAAKRSILGCDSSFTNYCLNNGECMFLVDVNENHCKCEVGFHGSRCEQPQLVSKKNGNEQLAVIIVCVILLIIGLAGALYFFCKWYKRNRLSQPQKRQGYRVQTA